MKDEEGIAVSKELFAKKRTDIIDSLALVALLVGLITCIVGGNFILGLATVCLLIGHLNSIENGSMKIKVETNLEERFLYKVENEDDKTYYILASSADEVGLYCLVNKIKDGDINLVGKVGYFE